MNAEDELRLHQDSQAWIKIGVRRATYLKINTQQADSLQSGSEKCVLEADRKVSLKHHPQRRGNYYVVELDQPIPNCDFDKGYVYKAHTADASRGQTGVSSATRAFLEVIAFAEGTGPSYNVSFTGRRFSSFRDHPRAVYCSGSLCSDAAGRYQFLSTTWDMVRRNLRLQDFSPANQDQGALYLMKSRGVSDTWRVYSYAQFQNRILKLNQEWASLPGSPYGQPTKSWQQLWRAYREAL